MIEIDDWGLHCRIRSSSGSDAALALLMTSPDSLPGIMCGSIRC